MILALTVYIYNQSRNLHSFCIKTILKPLPLNHTAQKLLDKVD